jgi:acyl-CoA synthetase (AMP-forming)/AMP-acid ligase II
MSEPPFSNIASHLPRMAERRPNALAVVFPHGRDSVNRVSYTHLTFRQLDDESNLLAAGLEAVGIARATRTALMVTPSLDFFALTFALFKIGAIPILIDPGMGIKNIGRCLAEADPSAFIGVPKAHVARVVLGWAKPSLKTLVTVGRRGPWAGLSLDQVRERGRTSSRTPADMTRPEDTAAILFTSGSTGPPKGAVYTHRIFTTQVEILRSLYQIEEGEIDLATFPLFALFAPALGMTAIIPDMDATRPAQVDSRKIFEAIADFGVTNLFGSPALLDRVGRDGEAAGLKLPSLRRVLSAGAPVRAHVIERFSTLLRPEVEIFTPYGATESLPVASIGSHEILRETRSLTAEGKGVCLGRPVESTHVAIIKISDDAIPRWSDDLLEPPGTVGEIVSRGPVVTRSYFSRPEATALAKIGDVDGSLFHRMGDLGYFDARGRLWFCGRKSQRVETPSGVLFTICCEAVFNEHPAVSRTALVGVGPKGQARPVICVELKPEHATMSRKRLVRELLELGGQRPHTSGIRDVLFHSAFPVDIRHNAKIFRETLAVWATRRLK